MYIPINNQIICGCCGYLQPFNPMTGIIEDEGYSYHDDKCCKYEEIVDSTVRLQNLS